MLSRYALMFCAAALSLVSITAANAADKTRVVKFRPGATSATIHGSVKRYDVNTYVLEASAGQTLSVIFVPDNGSCYYNVEGPGGSQQLFNGSTAFENFSVVLPVDGNYEIKPYLMRNAARRNETCRFSLTVEIRN